MNYLTELTKEELKYICKEIPYNIASDYFRRHPKEFTKIRPGFRVKSLSEDMIARTLYEFRNTDYIASFIIKVVNKWLSEIEEELSKILEEGKDQETAYIEVLSQSFFAQNASLYFKIKEENKTEEYIGVLSAAVKHQADRLRNDQDEIRLLKKNNAETDKKVEELNRKLAEGQKKEEQLRRNARELQVAYDEKTVLVESEKQEKEQLINEIRLLEIKLKKAEEDGEKKAEGFVKKTALLVARSEEYENQIEELKKRLEETDGIISEYRTTLESSKDGSESLKSVNMDLEGKISVLRAKIIELEQATSALKAENTVISTQNEEYQQAIKALEEVIENTRQNSSVSDLKYTETKKDVPHSTPLGPVDMDDFDEYFRYNLASIGFSETEEGGIDLVEYFKQTVFNGIPLLIKRGPGINLANCLANTIYGKPSAITLAYKNGMEIVEIEDMLTSTSDRVVCLDGFIGNCNEMELLPVLDRYRNKIIILTYMYDKTLRYIPEEILSSVYFISMDRFSALMRIKDITEDPSEILEKEFVNQNSCSDKHSRKIFIEIAQECGIEMGTASAMADGIENEIYMNRLLIFTLLPYVVNVFGISPYNCSKRLQKYASESGRCPNKEIIMRWFG